MSGNTLVSRSVVFASALLFGCAAAAQSVAFINPGKSDEIYWVTATQSMRTAADSLGMRFEVQYAEREHLKTLDIAREMVSRPPRARPEYIVITNDYGVAGELLKIVDGAGIKTFLAYSSIPADQRGPLGSPRTVFKGWLGSLEPRAEDAGYLTARALIAQGIKAKAYAPDGKLHMIAIAGDRSTPSSIKRNEGMRRAVAENARVVLEQEVYAAWTRDKAAEQSAVLFQRYPHARLIWAGNDLMAFGAMQSWEKRGGTPGVDAWFSGINTSTEALESIRSGRMTALAGGHFVTGAWAMVMIYDYHRGRDFTGEGLELERSMFAQFDPALAERYLQRFGNGFSGVDFRRYSKALNPKVQRYDFGFAQLLAERPTK
ncbi:MAG TPA: ABC transporter substrate-binding protein [Burkholderiales bacterium]|nr:ABC transporter substrate-binding protein [Burkholderiales bacterium]